VLVDEPVAVCNLWFVTKYVDLLKSQNDWTKGFIGC
jgi:hypothetical protein